MSLKSQDPFQWITGPTMRERRASCTHGFSGTPTMGSGHINHITHQRNPAWLTTLDYIDTVDPCLIRQHPVISLSAFNFRGNGPTSMRCLSQPIATAGVLHPHTCHRLVQSPTPVTGRYLTPVRPDGSIGKMSQYHRFSDILERISTPDLVFLGCRDPPVLEVE